MKVLRISEEPTINQEQTFKRGLKLSDSVMKSASRTLEKDTFELRSKLPKNEDSKVQKYFGEHNPEGDTNADAIFAGILVAAGLGLALL